MKKLFSLFFIGVISTAIYLSTSTQAEVTDILLENIAALAAGESSGAINCAGIGSVHCPISNSNVYMVLGGYSLEIFD